MSHVSAETFEVAENSHEPWLAKKERIAGYYQHGEAFVILNYSQHQTEHSTTSEEPPRENRLNLRLLER